MADKTNDSSAKKTPHGMSKKEAVEKGLQTLGYSATPTQLQKHIREHYKMEMGLKHISTAKAKLVKAARPSKQAIAKATAAKRPAKQSAAAKPASGTEGPKKATAPHVRDNAGISLKDIESVKDLVERVGATSLKKLIDVMAR